MEAGGPANAYALEDLGGGFTLFDCAKENRPAGRPVEGHGVKDVSAGERLQLKLCDAKVLHLPGRTPGLVCLHVEARRMLFADDHVLAKVSPNALLDLSLGETDAT